MEFTTNVSEYSKSSGVLRPNFSSEFIASHAGNLETPVLLGSRQMVIRRLRQFREALPDVYCYFAIKANCNPQLLRLLFDEGIGFDLASTGEWDDLQAALGPSAHDLIAANSNRISISHPCKRPRDIERFHFDGLKRWVFDSRTELLKLAKYTPGSEVLLRIAVPNRSGTVNLANRFGAKIDEAIELAHFASDHGLSIDGLAFHVGSQAVDPEDFGLAFDQAKEIWLRLHQNGYRLSTLNMGGGFPISYADSAVPSLVDYCRRVRHHLHRAFPLLPDMVMAEPGRCLCAEAFTLVVSIIGSRDRDGVRWYTIDDGIYGTFSGRYFSRQAFEFRPMNNLSSPLVPSVICGPTCDGGDIIAEHCLLPELRAGDRLVVENVGAYCSVGASGFNGMPVTPTVWID
jgi:ornithine decarboxylase